LGLHVEEARRMTNVEGSGLQDLSDEALALRRREFVRDYDRALRREVRDLELVARIWAESAAIADEQQNRDPVRLRRDDADWLWANGLSTL
jgi:hypothetical protein